MRSIKSVRVLSSTGGRVAVGKRPDQVIATVPDRTAEPDQGPRLLGRRRSKAISETDDLGKLVQLVDLHASGGEGKLMRERSSAAREPGTPLGEREAAFQRITRPL